MLSFQNHVHHGRKNQLQSGKKIEISLQNRIFIYIAIMQNLISPVLKLFYGFR